MDEVAQKEIAAIKERNARVEANKAWETSRVRAAALAALTYATMLLLMTAIGVENPWLSALVPTAGFLLSTLSLRAVKTIWLKRIYRPVEKA